uniref:Ribokinase n=1 Tax=Syphacia muris TaxID=451379 RepID=A0A0N5ATZ9_9BILA
MSFDIVVVGSIVQDLVSYTKSFPRPGESVIGSSFEAGPGGKGANQAAQCARLGGKVLMIGRVGSDIFAPLNIESLKHSGVAVDYIEKDEVVNTSTAMITVTSENTVVVTLGANLELLPERIEQLESVIAASKIMLCQFEIQSATLLKALEVAKRTNVKTFFNFAPPVPDFDKSALKLVDYLCTNESETEFLSGREVKSVDDAIEAAKSLLSYGPTAIIVTMGGQGAVLATKEAVKHISVPPVKAVDTTGAGDSFCGSLAYLLVYKPELTLEEQVRRACLVASISVQKKGTQNSYPWAKDLPAEWLS